MAKIIKTIFQVRRDTTANWLLHQDIIPAAGEPCLDLDTGIVKWGDGKTTYGELRASGTFVEGDGNTIVIEDDVVKLVGFDEAESGAQPRKNAEGKIEWVVPSTETVDGIQSTVAGMQSDIVNLQTNVTEIQEIINPTGEGEVPLLSRVETLEDQMNGTGENSVDAKINTKINEFATNVSDDGVVNSYKELIDYVANHGDEAVNMAKDISTLQSLVGNVSVADQIEDALNKGLASAMEEAYTVFDRVEYVVSNKPEGTLVDYRDKEIRVMCPADTKFEHQNSGENADANLYYIGFKAYAPDNAVSFKEDLAETIADDTMYSFEGNDFAGIDDYGRKYSIVWLPVAVYANDVWTYYGASSTADRYIGWYYSVEWYGADGKVIAFDTIRINLSNEACHNTIKPFYLADMFNGVSMNGTLLEKVNGVVDIPVASEEKLGVVKASKEDNKINVLEDGTMELNGIYLSKIIQDIDVLILDGGSCEE